MMILKIERKNHVFCRKQTKRKIVYVMNNFHKGNGITKKYRNDKKKE